MTARVFGSAAVLAALAGVAVMSVPVSGQGSSAPPLVITAFGGKTPDYVAPRTPWGDPDLQGVWSSDDMSGIPMSRPEQFGDRLYLNDEEYAARVKQVEQGVDQAENDATSTFRFDFGRRAFRQTSQIVDPPDGRMPATTELARSRPMPRGTFGAGPATANSLASAWA